MKNVKRVISLILAVALSLSLVGSSTDAFSVSAAGEDDLIGWEKGDFSTLTGNPEDGWKLSFAGGNEMVRGNFYTAETAASRLQIKLDLSTLESGGGFFLQLGDQKYIGGTWNDTGVGFYLIKNDDTTLEIQGYDASKSWPYSLLSIQKMENFDFTAPHIFEFQYKNGTWNAVIDDIILVGDQVQAGVEKFMEGMESKEKTVIGILPNSWTTYEIRNISFARNDEKDDLTGWTVGTTSTLSGNSTNGWELKQGLWSGTSSAYQAEIDITKLHVGFNLSNMEPGMDFVLGFGKEQNGFEKDQENKAIYILMGKNTDNTLNLQFFNEKINWLGEIKVGIDWAASHDIGLVKNGNDWGLAVDGVIKWTNAHINETVQYMSDSKNSTKVTFTSRIITDDTIATINNIHFTEKYIDLTGWTLGATSKMSGNPEEGWQIDFTGVAEITYGTSYQANVDVSKLQVKFNLSDLPAGKMFFLQMAKEKGEFTTGAETRINMALERTADGKLTFYGFDSGRGEAAIYNYHGSQEFDFEADHVFQFLQHNGKWVPALDETKLYGDDDTNEIYDSFVKSMQEKSAGATTVSFAPNSGDATVLTIKNIYFTEKPAVLRGYSATLEGMIGYNYHVSLSKELAGRDDVFMRFSYGDGITQDVPMDPIAYDKENDVYIFTCKVPAKHMADTITAQLYAGDELVRAYPGGQTVAYTSSVKEYAAGVLKQLETDNTDTSAVTKTLVKNMLHYGAYAQKYFRYNTGNLADAGLDDLVVSDVTQGSFQTAFGQTNLNADGFGKIVGSNLYLKSETDLKVYIELAEGVDADKLTFTCQDKSSEPLKIGRYTRNGKELVTVTIPNIAAHELDKVWEIAVAKKDDSSSTGTWKYSVFTYAYNALDAGYTPDTTKYGISIKELMKAMYKYNEAALVYKKAASK